MQLLTIIVTSVSAPPRSRSFISTKRESLWDNVCISPTSAERQTSGRSAQIITDQGIGSPALGIGSNSSALENINTVPWLINVFAETWQNVAARQPKVDADVWNLPIIYYNYSIAIFVFLGCFEIASIPRTVCELVLETRCRNIFSLLPFTWGRGKESKATAGRTLDWLQAHTWDTMSVPVTEISETAKEYPKLHILKIDQLIPIRYSKFLQYNELHGQQVGTAWIRYF